MCSIPLSGGEAHAVHAWHEYRIAQNIGGEFVLANWLISHELPSYHLPVFNYIHILLLLLLSIHEPLQYFQSYIVCIYVQ